MDEQFDNDLRNRIREVFDNYEDPTANDGWLLLREKFPEQKKRRAIAWIWWGAAASLLLVAGLGLWVNYSNNQPVKLAGKIAAHKQNEKIAATNGRVDTNHIEATAIAQAPPKAVDSGARRNQQTTQQIAGVKNGAKPVVYPGLLNGTSVKKTFIAKSVPKNKTNTGKITANQLAVTTAIGHHDIDYPPVEPAIITPPIEVNNQQAVIPSPNKSMPNNTVSATQPAVINQPKTITANPVIAATPPAKKTINDMFNESSSVKSKEQDKEEKMQQKRVIFAVYAATYFNYAKGSNNEINAGAGFTADIKLTDNLSLVTGVTIAQNSLSYNSLVYNTGIPISAVQTGGFLAATSTASPGTANFYGIQAKDVSPAASPTLKNYDASLVGLDVPVNLKYHFSSLKSNTYFLLGFSSGTFINEAYTYQYNYPIVNSASLQQTQNQTARSSFNSFYFARTLNAAFGMGLPFGKNHLVIEPFLKYPLEGLGSQQIKFGSGGLNLKFNFQPAESRKLKD